MQKRQYYSAKFKAKGARKALKEDKTIPENAAIYNVDPSMVARWKNEVLENSTNCFTKKRGPKPANMRKRSLSSLKQ